MRAVLVMAMSAVLAGCSLFGIRSGYEQPGYSVVERLGEDTEIRRYEGRLAAEATVPGDASGDADDSAFRLLFDYIGGENRGNAEIAMTAPVATQGTEIAMTAPVAVDPQGAEQYTMRFFLPSGYSMDRAPRPTDPRVRLVRVPAQTMAVLRYSGFRSEEKAAAMVRTLRDALSGTRWRPSGEAVSYYYDPPWTLPFLRRNEAAIRVEPREGPAG